MPTDDGSPGAAPPPGVWRTYEATGVNPNLDSFTEVWLRLHDDGRFELGESQAAGYSGGGASYKATGRWAAAGDAITLHVEASDEYFWAQPGRPLKAVRAGDGIDLESVPWRLAPVTGG